MVTAVTFRAPGLLVKAVTTLDVLSGGRAWLGLGAGYHEDEARAMGLPLPPIAERFERLEETLRLALQMWAGDAAPFEGAHYRLERPITARRRSRGRTRRSSSAARASATPCASSPQYADACNLFDIPDGGSDVRHKLDVLAGTARRSAGRTSEIEKTVSTRLEPGETARAFADAARPRRARHRARGRDHLRARGPTSGSRSSGARSRERRRQIPYQASHSRWRMAKTSSSPHSPLKISFSRRCASCCMPSRRIRPAEGSLRRSRSPETRCSPSSPKPHPRHRRRRFPRVAMSLGIGVEDEPDLALAVECASERERDISDHPASSRRSAASTSPSSSTSTVVCVARFSIMSRTSSRDRTSS